MTLKGNTILEVDDNLLESYAVVRILKRAHSKVLIARTGNDALALAAEHPNLILLDVELPDMNGFDLCRRLRNDPRTADIPVVFLSGTSQVSEYVTQGECAGGDVFLFKPIRPQQLLTVLSGQIVRSRRVPFDSTTDKGITTTNHCDSGQELTPGSSGLRHRRPPASPTTTPVINFERADRPVEYSTSDCPSLTNFCQWSTRSSRW